jgi:hypothetical protein
MAIPRDLQGVLSAARAALAANMAGELVLPQRRRIWTALGPRVMDGKRAKASPGLNRRAALAHACAVRVLPVWLEAWPKNDRPSVVLEAAQAYLARATDFDAAWKAKEDFSAMLEERQCAGKHFPAVYAGYAAGRALTVAIYDETWDPEHVDEQQLDQNLDPYQWDAALYASAAAAGSFTWEPRASVAPRRAFWEWYLTEAVPAAWEQR